MLSRRVFLGAPLAIPFAARSALGTQSDLVSQTQSDLASQTQSDLASQIYMSCADDRQREHYIVGFDLAGQANIETRFKIKLPARGHGYAQHAAVRETIVFGRRPGSFFVAVDAHAGNLIGLIEPPKARCFYGHGTFSHDGALLYVCEHDDASGYGFIGVYDAARGYRRIGDFAAGGIGPHEVRLMPDGRTLVVAVGGIMTDQARDKLNIAEMDPSLAYIDAASGDVVEQVRTASEWHQLSIRHVDLDAWGRVAIAMQYEGDAGDIVPLAALHTRGDTGLTYLHAPEDESLRLKQYLGDIAFSADGRTICATSPVGSVAALWDARSGDYLATSEAADGCGIVALDDAFLVSGGDGRLRRLDARLNAPRAATQWLWDNHLIGIG